MNTGRKASYTVASVAWPSFLKKMETNMKNLFKKAAIALMVLGVATACAQTPNENEIKALLEKNMGDGAKVDKVTKTEYAGLYEVQANGNIFYTDGNAKYVFLGNVIDVQSRKNLTRERVEELSKITFGDLPLDSAIKTVRGDGSRVIAVFSDPNCGYCKRLENNLKAVDNVTVYTFMYNILSADSAKKSKDIWCAKDRNKAWEAWMLKGKVPPAASAKCEDPGQKIFDLGRKLKVDGTPTIYFTDGSRVSGAIDAKAFEEKFGKLK